MLKSYEGYLISLLAITSLLSIITGISTIISKNPVYGVLFLIGLFLIIAIYLSLVGMNFMALGYLLIYVGAISVLFIFIIMLINIRVSELITEGKNSIILALITILSFNLAFNNLENNSYKSASFIQSVTDIFKLKITEQSKNNAITLLKDNLNYNFNDYSYYPSKNEIENFSFFWEKYMSNVVTVKNSIWETIFSEMNHASAVGNIIYSSLYIFLILVSLILLLSMVGSITIMVNKTTHTDKNVMSFTAPHNNIALTINNK